MQCICKPCAFLLLHVLTRLARILDGRCCCSSLLPQAKPLCILLATRKGLHGHCRALAQPPCHKWAHGTPFRAICMNLTAYMRSSQNATFCSIYLRSVILATCLGVGSTEMLLDAMCSIRLQGASSLIDCCSQQLSAEWSSMALVETHKGSAIR